MSDTVIASKMPPSLVEKRGVQTQISNKPTTQGKQIMRHILSKEQFINFLGFLWKERETTWTEDFWGTVIKFESKRRFSEGHNLCNSNLRIECLAGAGVFYEWRYETTSGTLLMASEYVDRWQSEADTSSTQWEVTIPEHREGGLHETYVLAILAGLKWLGQEIDGFSPEAIRLSAFLNGTTPEQVVADRSADLLNKINRPARRQQQAAELAAALGDYQEWDEDEAVEWPDVNPDL
jgi:hypothetical protein